MKVTINKIISGGQTGADQAGLDFAIQNNIPHGGYIPKGRLTEEGVLSSKYNLEEMKTKSYPARTIKNIVSSDATIIFTHGKLTGGSLLTKKKSLENQKQYLHIDFNQSSNEEAAAEKVSKFLDSNSIQTINIAGSRASKDFAIYQSVLNTLNRLLK